MRSRQRSKPTTNVTQANNANREHRVDTVHTEVELAVVNSSEDYVSFMYPLFPGGRAKNDQLSRLGKFSMPLGTNGMHASTCSNLPSMHTKRWVH